MVKTMTKAMAVKSFKKEIRPGVIKRYGLKDKAAMRLAWGMYIDGLCRSELVTMKQYETWTNPF